MKTKTSILKATLSGIVAAAGLMAFSSQAMALTPEGQLARGGQLYDWYYKITDGDVMKKTHASMPKDAGKTGKKTWRCSTCHGFTYTGQFGLPNI
ncbi:MAG: hypothetical protein JKY27_11730, partial [Magnetovibrio sp.]|nr:hypothetical protein [Magnetovibrio sp.]